MLRRLRIAASVFFAVLAVAFVLLWVRSYWWADNFLFKSSGAQAVGGVSAIGELTFGLIPSPTKRLVQWETERVPSRGEVRAQFQQYFASVYGFGISRPGAPGTLVAVPHWFAILLTSAVAISGWKKLPLRFSLRTMLIAITLVAMLLGLFVVSRRF